ncbi:hypothetical protein UlMin_018715 [Ulmus minor]
MFKFTYYKQCCLLLCFILWSAFGLPTYTSSLDRDEEKTLRQIANTTGLDPNTEAYSRLFPEDPCKMKPYIVSERGNLSVKCNHCNNNVCHITELFMKELSLPGKLPKELVNLTYLEKIDFTRNCLEGPIPKEWAVMKHLNFISLQANRLSGGIPKEWINFPNLTYLSLEANNLSGEVPEELGKLANLTRLILSSNKFVGTLPKTLGEVKNLSDLRISDNSFNGPIPEFIGSLSQLKRLEMQATGMEGPVNNQTFRGLEQLEDLRISDINGTESTFPTLSNKNIRNLVLRHMNLSGTIPETIWNMENLKMLDVSFNNLEGELPAQELPALKYRFVGGNKLNGNVPKNFLSFKVKYVDISYNNFTWSTGCDKDSMDNVNSYRSSALTKNDGRLLPCSNIPNCQQSPRSSLHINCGGQDVTITNANGSLLYEGDISGTPKLNYNGPHWGFSSTGDFMDDDDREEYVVDDKEYSSEKLEPIYKTIRKSPMSLMYYGCLKNGNYTIKLHFPDITSRAKGYNKLARYFFDIYIQERLMWKDFSLEMEANKTGNKGVVEPSFNVSVTENRLEIRFYWAGKGTTCIPRRGNYGILISAISVCPKPRKTSRKPIVIGAITSVLCLFFVVGVIAWRTYRKTTRERDLTGLELITGSFTLRQLRAATNNFDFANKIGEGGFGSVYKGELADGTAIAVKKLSSKSRQGNREFVTEIGIISGLQHQNLVKFYGCCIDGNHLLLVYEYMENNCLARALFGSSKAEERSLKLDWAVRVKICVGIANGLAFLHEGSALKIVHRDIKATNVLLDRDLNAKISDFGLAKLHEEDESHISTRIAGTIGYMAPEYALSGFLTEKADVYSFGVVALEIVSGKNNTSYRPQNDCVCLLDYAFVLQKRKNLLEIVDPNLGNEFNKKEAEKIIKVALLCTNASAALRPTMSEVVSFLEGEGTLVEEVISDPGIYGDDLESDVRFKSLRNYYQQIQKKNNEENKDQAEPSSSATSAHDLYQINFESITISSKDLYPINPDSTSKSELSSLISRHSS